MCRFIFRCSTALLFLVAAYTPARGQSRQPADTLRKSEAYGIRLGVDLSRPLLSVLRDGYTGLELVGDYRLTQHWYAAAELGNESRNVTEALENYEDVNVIPIYDFTSKGSYLKVGADYNTYENWYGMKNSIIVGARYAFSTFQTDLNSYNYFNSNRYWNPEGFLPGRDAPLQLSGLNASWLEVLLGIKAELFANIYLSASVRIGMLLSKKESETMPHLWIPGFNRVTDNSRFGTGFNYTLSYMLPLYRKAREKAPDEPQ